MGFKMKTFNEILRDMATWIMTSNNKITNFYIGSVVRTLLEAVSLEVEALYFKMRSVFIKASDNAIYDSFDFKRKEATKSIGDITIEFGSALSQSVFIQKGSQFFTVPINGKTIYFESTQDITVPSGLSSATIQVVCREGGTVGNVPAMSIRRSVSSIPYLQTLYNATALSGGAPQETKESLKKRFATHIQSLSKGTTPAIEYACKQVPHVAGIGIKEEIGIVYIYAHDVYGNLTDQMKSDLNDTLYNYKPAGIKVILLPVTKKSIDLDITIILDDVSYTTDNYPSLIRESVTSYLNRHVVSKSLIKADLIKFIMNIDDNAILNVNTGLDQDIQVSNDQLIRAGNITVTVV